MSSPRVTYGDSPVSIPSYEPSTAQSGSTFQSVSGLTIHSASLVGGIHNPSSPDEVNKLERFSIGEGIKQAMLNGIATAPDGLSVRPFIPDIDFIDGNNNAIGRREWLQPWSGTYTNVSAGSATTIYQTGYATRYDRKVMVFWGLAYTAVGNQRSAGVTDTASVIFSDTANTILDIWSPQRLDTLDAVYAFAPVIYQNTRAAKIQLLPKYGASGAFETIEFIGRVVEPIGDTVQGARAISQ